MQYSPTNILSKLSSFQTSKTNFFFFCFCLFLFPLNSEFKNQGTFDIVCPHHPHKEKFRNSINPFNKVKLANVRNIAFPVFQVSSHFQREVEVGL